MKDRLLAALAVGGAVTLLLEIRFEHRDAIHEEWAAWIPLAYSALLAVAGAIALVRWRPAGRVALGALFAAGILVGACGIWFHTGGHPVSAVTDLVAAWRGAKISARPPPLAPLAFCGLGAIGALACLERLGAGRR